MGSTLRLLLQLLLLSLVSASHYFGGTTTFTYKGKNPDGSFKVDIRDRDTYDGCYYSLYWYCSNSNCGYPFSTQRKILDSSTSAPMYNRQWCEAETVTTRVVWDNKPFQMWASSCCWVHNIYYGWGHSWTLSTLVDLGERSDTKQPNRSPEIAILPFLRVPQNCPRTYRLMSFDPDGDKVRCRYGNPGSQECAECIQNPGFHLDQDSCTLHYQNTNADPSVRSFEIVVEDFPQGHISLNYTDGSRSYRSPLSARRRKRQVTNPWYTETTTPGWEYPWDPEIITPEWEYPWDPETTTTLRTTTAAETTTTLSPTTAEETTTTLRTTTAAETTTPGDYNYTQPHYCSRNYNYTQPHYCRRNYNYTQNHYCRRNYNYTQPHYCRRNYNYTQPHYCRRNYNYTQPHYCRRNYNYTQPHYCRRNYNYTQNHYHRSDYNYPMVVDYQNTFAGHHSSPQ
ncbi:uncharacterized protein LOC115799885 [Archocentrus centrarchus]|uniref:uncharacterized protein LOC115799885 n=1 Tax=Archocentrus centrarchus TaxID=63155 RepID=UPI0011E9D6D0|nr:uncharacterized protein LOC115799885 [Archocentrus centrarchus]